MCLRGSQKQSRAREQRWSHTHQHRITQPWWVDLGGKAVGERKCAFATTCSAMETNKVLHFVPSGKWIQALRSAPQLSTTQRSVGEPWGSLPSETWEPLCAKTCAAHLHFHSEGRQMFGSACVPLYILGVFSVCAFCVLRQCSVCDRILFLFSRGGGGGGVLEALLGSQKCRCFFAFFSLKHTHLPFFFFLLPLLVYVWYATPGVPALCFLQFRSWTWWKRLHLKATEG